MSKYTTVLFDLDGTLLNTIDDLADSVNYMLEENGFMTRTISEITAFVGNGVYKLVERSLPEEYNKALFEDYVLQFKKHYSEHSTDKTIPYAGIRDLLKELKNAGYNVAVISNKMDEQTKFLCEKFFEGLTDYSVGQKDSVPKKPAPDSVFDAMNYFSCNSEKAVYVGDSEVDYQTALNADIDFIGVSWGFRGRNVLEKLGAEKIADKTTDLLKLLTI